MPDNTLIYGKDAWPFTRAAREAFAKEGRQFEYINVIKEPDQLETMLQYSKGSRKVPVIVEGENVTIGFEGKAWGVWSFGWMPGRNDDGRLTKDELMNHWNDDGRLTKDELRTHWNDEGRMSNYGILSV